MVQSSSGFGILGMGIDLPDQVRTNDWWPASFVDRFAERSRRDITTPEVWLERAESPEQRIQMELMLETTDDPFRGAVERRIAAPDEQTSDYELRAARRALADAGVAAESIDCVLISSLPPDEFWPSNGTGLQERLGITTGPAIGIDTACASFVTGLAMADSLLRAGQASCVLLVVSALQSRMTDWNDAASVNFGDAAAALVIGRTRDASGFIAHSAGGDGRLRRAAAVGPKSDRPWFVGAGPLVVLSRDVQLGHAMVMHTTSFANEAVGPVLERAEATSSDVSNFYCHQPAVWFNEACRRALGLSHCRTTDTFSRYGSMGAANIPVNLYHARQQRQLAPGDLVLVFSFGMGIHWAASLFRWFG